MYIVYREFFDNGKIQRWYYGRYNYQLQADIVADDITAGDCYGCVCKDSDAVEFGVMGLPKN